MACARGYVIIFEVYGLGAEKEVRAARAAEPACPARSSKQHAHPARRVKSAGIILRSGDEAMTRGSRRQALEMPCRRLHQPRALEPCAWPPGRNAAAAVANVCPAWLRQKQHQPVAAKRDDILGVI